MLKQFNEDSEQVLSSISHLFEIYGWKFEENFHIINIETSYNALLCKP